MGEILVVMAIIILLSLPTIVLVFINWSMKDNFFKFTVNNEKRLDELEKQNKEILKELEALKQKSQ